MKEKDFLLTYMKTFESGADVWWYKIHDNKFTGKKPFDVFGYMAVEDAGLTYTVPFAWEFKLHKTIYPWPYDNVIPFQEESLEKVAKFRVNACIILGIKTTLTEKQQKELGVFRKNINLVKTWKIEDFKKDKELSSHFDVRTYIKLCHNVRS